MLNGSFRRLASILPRGFQDDCRRLRFCWRARNNHFSPKEPEAEILDAVIASGDWVLDIGANVGEYALLLSKMVGPTGRVLAFEPVPATAATLALICSKYAEFPNVSVLNLAASEQAKVECFEIPIDAAGLPKYEQAHSSATGSINVLGIAIDSLRLQHPISLAKIDAEGDEEAILKGMRQTIERDRPVLIIEDNCKAVPEMLRQFGYTVTKIEDHSPNVLYLPTNAVYANIRSLLSARNSAGFPLN